MRQSWLSCGVLVGFLAACSSSTSPKPSLAGTWHVSLQGLIATHVTPETLTVTVTQVNATSYHVTMAAIGWGDVPETFDSGAAVLTSQDTTVFGFAEYPTAQNRTAICNFVSFQGTKNSGLDTLTSASIALFNSDTVPGGYCTPTLEGTVTIHK